MSSAVPPPPPPRRLIPIAPAKIFLFTHYFGPGHATATATATAFCLFLLFSIAFLSSYICRQHAAARRRRQNGSGENRDRDSYSEDRAYFSRVFFLTEDEEREPRNIVVGLDQAVIDSYPKLVFAKRSGCCRKDTVCSICLGEYGESEVLRVLPDCKHGFHVMCVDTWLKLKASCPVCRNPLLPTPFATP